MGIINHTTPVINEILDESMNQINKSEKGSPNGVADLDENGYVPMSEINPLLSGDLLYLGSYNAETNTPPLPDPTTHQSNYYLVGVSGGTYSVGDKIISNGVEWQNIQAPDPIVTSVNTKTGDVIITKEDLGLSNVDNTSDLNKPISTLVNTELLKKVDKIDGYSLVPDNLINQIHAQHSDDQDLSNLVTKANGKSLVDDTEIAKLVSINTNNFVYVENPTEGYVYYSGNTYKTVSLNDITVDAYTRNESDTRFLHKTGDTASFQDLIIENNLNICESIISTINENGGIKIDSYIDELNQTTSSVVINSWKTDGSSGKTSISNIEKIIEFKNGNVTKAYILGDGSITAYNLSGTNTGDQDLSGLQPKETGKGLSTNDYTDDEQSKLYGIETDAQVNIIEGVKVNGTDLTIDAELNVNVLVPTATSDLENDTDFVSDDNYVHTDNNFTSTLKTNYDTAYTNTHTHSNKYSLDLVIGTNTGDETLSTIKTKLGTANANTDGYLTTTDWNIFNTKQSALTFSTGLSNTEGTVTVNTSQNITTLSNLTSNGLVKTSGSNGTLGTAIAGTDFVAPNAAITGATKTKITYDAKGLVTSGTDATTADIAASTNKNYVTDAQLTVIQNTSGTNTGDQDLSGETLSRISGDTYLQEQVTNNYYYITGLTSSLSNETLSRISGDTYLQEQVTNNYYYITGLTSSLSNETTARISGDTYLQEQVTNNYYYITGLTSSINNETLSRISGDTYLQEQVTNNYYYITGLTSSINNETLSRISGDTYLQSITTSLSTELDLKAMQNPGICQKLPIRPNDIIIDQSALTFTIATINSGQTISASNPIRFFTDGSGIINKWEKYSPQTVSFTKTNGVWYIHYDNTGILIATQTPWTDFNIIAPIYRFYVNDSITGTSFITVRAFEAHLNDISASDHAWKHAQGTIHESGFDIVCNKLTSGSPNITGLNTCISLSTGKNSDDGLEYTVTNTTTPTTYFQQDLGSNISATLSTTNGGLFKCRINDSVGRLYFLNATRFPFVWDSSTNRPQYINAVGTITPVANTNFFVYYVYALQDDLVGEAIKIVSAEIEFTTLTLANAHAWENLQALYATLNDKEIRPLYKLIFEYRSSYNVSVKYSVLRDYNDIRKQKVTSTAASAGSVLASNVVTVPKTIQTATNLDSNMQIIDNLLVGGTTSQVLTSGVGSIPTWTTQSAANVLASAKTKVTGTTVESQLQSINDSFIKGITSSVDNELVRFDSTTGKVIQGGSCVTVSDTGDVIIPGNVTINGTLTTINTDTLQVKDKNIELGYLTSGTPTDVTANGGGITLKGATDKNITWLSSNDSWNFDKPIITTGNITANSIVSTTATGTSPLTIASTTVVPNLNADLLDGVQANDIARLVAFTPSPDLNINKWTKIASLQAPGDYSPFSLTLSIDVIGQSYGSCIVNFTARQETSGGGIIIKNVKILSAVGDSTFIDGSIKMVNNGYAQPFEIWLKSTAQYNTYTVRELNKNLSSYSLTYYSNYAWTDTEPTGTYTATNTGLAYLNSSVLHTGMLDYVKLSSDGSSVDISGHNLNNIRVGGFYRGNNLVNAPLGASTWFYITVVSYLGLSWSFQEAVSYGPTVGGTGDIPTSVKYRRSLVYGDYWQPWEVVYDATNANNATTKWTAGLLSVYPVNGGDYNEGIRIHPKDGYSILALGAVDGDSGRGEGQWTFIKHPVASNHMLTIRHYTTDIVTIQKEGQLLIGDKTGTPTTSPISLSLGGTHSNVAGSNIKLKIYEDSAGNPPAGFGVSAGRLEYVVGNVVEDHVFYAVTTELFKLKGNGNIELMVANATVDGRDISVDGTKLDTLKKDTYINIIDGVAAGSQTIIPQGTGYRGISDIIIKCTSSVNVTYPSSIDVKYYDYTNTLRTIICPTTAIPGIIQRVTSIFGISPLPMADLSYGPITVEWAKSGGTPTEHKYEIICKID